MGFLRKYKWNLVRLCVIYLIAVVGLFYFQEEFIFYPEKTEPSVKYSFSGTFEEKFLDVETEKIHSLLFHGKQTKGVILYFHGNAGNLESWGHTANELAERTGWSVWAVDYPGYGKSTGEINSESQLHAIAESLFLAAELELPGQKKLAYGRSIGTGLATRLATKFSLSGLLLETPYYNLPELAQEKVFFAPAKWILKYQFMNNLDIVKIGHPIWIVHGTNDELIPFENGKRLTDLMPNRIHFTAIPEGRHNNLSDFADYWTGLEIFLNTL